MMILAVLLALAAMALDALVVVKLTMRQGFLKGMLALLFFPYAFYWGWKRRDTEDLRRVMQAWTATLAALALLTALSMLANH
ncbi:MAG: hypothetical protein JXA78_18375 [Anaerolineales bacterium]|nr:hypothetical protein [Anaerolineales bacterium]